MRLVLWLTLATTGCSALAQVPSPAPAEDGAGFTVTGTATVRAVPDVADLTATLAFEALRPADAARQLKERQSRFLAALTASGVAPEDVAVSHLSLDPVEEVVDRGPRTRVRGYRAAVTITVTTRDFEALAGQMELFATEGATGMSSRFRIGDEPALRRQAREQAARAARDKAQQVADVLGVELGRVRTIVEEPGGGWLDNNYAANAVRIEVADDVHGVSQAVTVSVTLTFDLG